MFPRRLLFVSAILVSAFFPLLSGAGMFGGPDPVIETIAGGDVNWTKQVVLTSGTGVIDSNIRNTAVAKLSAERAAKISAIRNALETIKGIKVDSYTTVENYMPSDYILGRINAAVGRAKIVEKRYLPDGEIDVVVEVPLTGILTEALVFQTSPLPVPTSGEEIYSGLIVDAKGLGINPAMSPKILDEMGREVYGASFVSRGSLINRGLAGYLKEVDDAMEDDRVAPNPLVVKALRRAWTGSTDIIITLEDAAMLHDGAGNSSFLEQCRVIIVVD